VNIEEPLIKSHFEGGAQSTTPLKRIQPQINANHRKKSQIIYINLSSIRRGFTVIRVHLRFEFLAK
jgi:hypothetical protein